MIVAWWWTSAFLALVVPLHPTLRAPPTVRSSRLHMEASAASQNPNRTQTVPLSLWTLHMERPDDPAVSCFEENGVWFCEHDSILSALSDADDSF